jgi:hypothetical protein
MSPRTFVKRLLIFAIDPFSAKRNSITALLFRTHVAHRLHFESSLLRYYLAGNLATTCINAGHLKASAHKIFIQQNWAEKINVLHYFLGAPRMSMESNCGMILTGKTEELGEKRVSAVLRRLQIPL